MNKITISGNLTRDPELRYTQNGVAVCNFNVAVNRRNRGQQEGQQQETDFFRVTVWRQMGEACGKFLAKGRKVLVIGPVSASTYQANDGSTRVQLEVTADEVEFLSSRNDTPAEAPQTASQPQQYQTQAKYQYPQQESSSGFTAVETDELPF